MHLCSSLPWPSMTIGIELLCHLSPNRRISVGFWSALHNKIHELILGELSFLQYFSSLTYKSILLHLFIFTSLSKCHFLYYTFCFFCGKLIFYFWMLSWLTPNHPNCCLFVVAGHSVYTFVLSTLLYWTWQFPSPSPPRLYFQDKNYVVTFLSL